MIIDRLTVVITGGSAGIGLALARKFLTKNHRVIITGRNVARLKKALIANPGLEGLVSDVTQAADRDHLRKWIEDQFERFDVLINNAGVGGGGLISDPGAMELIESQIVTNLLAPIQLTHALLPLMNRSGTVINVTSGYALWPCVASPGYSAAKAGLSAFSLALREQLRGEQIHVMEVCPPMVETEMTSEVKCRKISADVTADAIIRGLNRKQDRVLIGSCRVLELSRRYFPKLTHFIMNRWPVSIADLKNSNAF